MPANLDEPTQRIILLVSSFTTAAIALPALYAQFVMIPNYRQKLNASNVIAEKSCPSLLVGCLACVALMCLATIVMTMPILLGTNVPLNDQTMLSSSINFCEQDFTNSPYIAEPANTVSSLTCYVPLALLGLFGPPSTANINRSKRFVVIYVTLLAIGIGSMALHTFLTAKTQGGDELPMLWFTAAAAFCAIDVIVQQKMQLLGVVVAASAFAATATYVVGRHDFTVFYILFSIYSQTMIFSVIYITFGIDWDKSQTSITGTHFKSAVLFPLAIATGWSTIIAIWTWVSEMLFCNAVMQDGAFGKVVAPFVWNRVIHPMWHFWSGLLAWLLVQVLVAAHGMQRGWGVASIQWFGAPYVSFRVDHSCVKKDS